VDCVLHQGARSMDDLKTVGSSHGLFVRDRGKYEHLRKTCKPSLPVPSFVPLDILFKHLHPTTTFGLQVSTLQKPQTMSMQSLSLGRCHVCLWLRRTNHRSVSSSLFKPTPTPTPTSAHPFQTMSLVFASRSRRSLMPSCSGLPGTSATSDSSYQLSHVRKRLPIYRGMQLFALNISSDDIRL
jgi:hypothetical protein